MKKITLKPFQVNAIEGLKKEVLHRWRRDTRQDIKFQSPTGSGKTVMMAQFVRDLVNAPELSNADFAFLWVSIGGSSDGDLAYQSRNKFDEYYGGASEVAVTGLDSLSREKKMEQNEILFFNWSKIKTRNKDGRKLRRENEQEITWDGMIQRTHAEERDIILIIDEAHNSSSTLLAEEEIRLINPKMVIHITATHRDQSNIDVHVTPQEVVQAGLIKELIKSQTQQDFKDKRVKDLDKHVLKLSLKKRKEIASLYKKEKVDVNPLLMIQLPNDDRANQEEETKKESVLRWLKEEGVDENTVAIWLDKEKTRLENITMHNNGIDILLFKQAPATGWDCPRAQVLLMYRETKDPVFQVQVLGRILRMPEGKHYTKSKLNSSYLYTTYTKNEIIDNYGNYQGENQLAIFRASIKKAIEQIKLKTFVSQRTSYNDLGKTFQFTFIKTANKAFDKKKSFQSCFTFGEEVELDLIVDQDIRDYDGFIQAIKEADSLGQKMSRNDIEKLYKKLCIEILHKQEEETKFKNIARSYGKLKSAINVWFEKYVGIRDKNEYYPCVVNDLNRGANSILLPVINKALEQYVSVRSKEEEERDKKKVDTKEILIPLSDFSYTSNYEEISSTKCAMSPCYVNKNNENERKFIEYLENNASVEWWYKNGENGSEHFSIRRDSGNLFFPDWFIKTKKDIWVVDTKGGFTAEGESAVSRAKALDIWLKENKNFKGGLVKEVSGLWKIAKDTKLEKWVDWNFE
ncbi:MAG: DEAD/DEAH box helicase family protein [Candidatus Kaiserbacteria bacterium]|nr:DEAD/DEAH box helicase family protein [Candidatus Kaiserbacteria bacterium]